MDSDRGAVLLVTGRRFLVEAVTAIAAAVGIAVVVREGLAEAGARWLTAPLVMLGDDVAALGVPTRRPDVVVLGPRGAPDRLWRAALDVGAGHVALLPDDQQWLLERLCAAAEEPADAAVVLGALGGRGGAGTTTFAACLAVTAASDRRALLMDLDPLGPGYDILLGSASTPGLRWPDLHGLRGPVRAATLREALPRVGGLSLLSWSSGAAQEPRAEAAEAVLTAARRGFDLVVVDVPRSTAPATLAALTHLDALFLLVPAEVGATLAAARVLESVRALVADIRVVVRGPSPGGLAAGEVAEVLGLPLHSELRSEPRLAAALERGDLPTARGPMRRLCRDLVRLVDDAGPTASPRQVPA